MPTVMFDLHVEVEVDTSDGSMKPSDIPDTVRRIVVHQIEGTGFREDLDDSMRGRVAAVGVLDHFAVTARACRGHRN